MAFCRKCGQELKDDLAFCTKCGEKVEAAASAVPAAAPASAATPAPSVRRGRKALWISLAALVVVIAVACVLVFVAFHDQIFGAGTSGPEQKVQEALTIMENKDVDALMAMLDPQGLVWLENTTQIGAEDLAAAAADEMTAFDSIEFSDVKMKTAMEEDGQKATVTLVGGQMTTVSGGETTVEELKDSDPPVSFYMVQRDGTWYIDIVRSSTVSDMTS